MDERVDDIIAFADIGEFIHQPTKMYSSGMFARLAFAVAINVEPDILIVDEALSVGDEKFQRKCYAKIEEMAQQGCTILFVTHATSLLESICDSGLLLVKGSLVGFGQSKDVVEKYRELLYGTTRKDTTESVMKQVDEQSRDDMVDQEQFITDIQVNEFCGIKIHRVWIRDKSGKYGREEFHPHENVYFGLRITAYEDVDELMIGIRIKTMEGVEVFGGSSDYLNQNIQHIKKATTFDIEIGTKLSLCEGSYFVTLAVADKSKAHGMLYQDKLVDILNFKIVEYPMQSSGIASLEYNIEAKEIFNGK